MVTKLEYDFFSPLNPVVLSVVAPFVSLLWTRAYNAKPGHKAKNLIRAWEMDDFSALLADALERRRPVAITLENRKVYVGMVASTLEPTEDDGYLKLLPLYSGYRDKDSLKMHLRNLYSASFRYVKGEGEEEFAVDDLFVVFPRSQVVAVHIFNPKIYDRVSRKGRGSIVSESSSVV